MRTLQASIVKSEGAGEANGAEGGDAMETDEAPAAAAGTGGEPAKPAEKEKDKGKGKSKGKGYDATCCICWKCTFKGCARKV